MIHCVIIKHAFDCHDIVKDESREVRGNSVQEGQTYLQKS